jgi:uncharacterized protein YyaL (SSP411 family)
MTNRLAQETSPYLLQHADNPVHWWAWGPDALAHAKASGKPILLSVGYAACHWCHVMAHESFEDEVTAAVMNDLFVNIKVDREERPDIDAIYMGALHRLGEQGGWPLTMFLDSDARPFWGGTYFPPTSRYGKPGFQQVLRQVADIYANDRETVDHNAHHITAMLAERAVTDRVFQITDGSLEDLTARLLRAVDPENGGLQGAPKFPQWNFFWLLWRGAIRYDQPLAKAAVEKTLAQICQGGIYDHLGGGFARYSVDERWLVPHFEKMLYDNALLIDLMTHVYRETRNPLFEVRIAETVAWLEREMIASDGAGGGAFAASLDADSEGEEGKFYVWTFDDLVEVLGADVAKVFGHIYDVAPQGNWAGDHNAPHATGEARKPTAILNRLGSRELMSDAEEAKLAILRAKLLAVRSKRVRPGWDDKVLADWNGLMISALAHASQVFGQPTWLALAQRAFRFVETRMQPDHRLRHATRAGRTTASATASDYANMIAAALALHTATGDDAYLATAQRWTAILDSHYWVADEAPGAPASTNGSGLSVNGNGAHPPAAASHAGGKATPFSGGYATTADDTTDVIVRLRAAADDAVPSANAIMLGNLVHLFLLTGDVDSTIARAEAIQRGFAADLARSLTGHTGFLAQSIDLIAPQQIVIVEGDGADLLMHAIHHLSLPGALVLRTRTPPHGIPTSSEGIAAAYVCLGTQCSAAMTDPALLTEHLLALRRANPRA